ncbi:MAG: nicotinate-nucleotide adenylyltransferase [Psychromonas sp.]|jgi:nicotinate-nucleotide adenylyltransferase|uniref:nicotinate-nucleotide adenylyltransferase n=1 Tax=Psychromonas sp. TaxID=1884585 RepID=UPI0039E42450
MDIQQQAIGFLGGTFDPIHFGHLRPALEITEALSLQQLFMMPNHIAPHKSASHGTAKQRSEMVELAISQQPRMTVDKRELKRHKPSYTIDTLKELKIEYPDTPICFIMGMDSLISFDSWYDWKNILSYCHLIISHRPGWQSEFNEQVAALVAKHQTTDKHDLHNVQFGKIYFQTTSQLAISSTEIRDLLSHNISIDFLTPDSVINYIKEQYLYK